MKTRLLKKLRKESKDSYKLDINYPNFNVVCHSKKGIVTLRTFDNICEAVNFRDAYRNAYMRSQVSTIRYHKSQRTK